MVLPKRVIEDCQVSYEFTKKILKGLDWPSCGPHPRIGSDGEMLEVVDSLSEDASDVGSDVEMAEVVDPFGKEASDAAKLFPYLAGKESTAAGSSVATKQSPTNETDIEDDDSVLPDPVKRWPWDIPKPQNPLTIVTCTVHLIRNQMTPLMKMYQKRDSRDN